MKKTILAAVSVLALGVVFAYGQSAAPEGRCKRGLDGRRGQDPPMDEGRAASAKRR